MQKNFQKSLEAILQYEGGFVNNPKDPGGATNLGVTIGVAKQLGLDIDHDGDVDIIDIKLLKVSDAAKVYKHEYWDKVRGDELPDGVDLAVFDYAVNSGVSKASMALQDAMKIASDGHVGPLTIAATKNFNSVDLIDKICNSRLAFLKRLSTFKTFGKGWTARVNNVKAKSKTFI